MKAIIDAYIFAEHLIGAARTLEETDLVPVFRPVVMLGRDVRIECDTWDEAAAMLRHILGIYARRGGQPSGPTP